MKVRNIALAFCFALPLLAQAQTLTPRVDQRQANQQNRISQGAQSGELTPRETARLERGQARVQRIEDRAKSDGVVTNKERARIHHAQDVESRKIYRQKHDRQTDYNRNGVNDRAERRGKH